MKIARLRIQGFRTVERGLDCKLEPLTVFTGANNSGKSGIVRALDLFFNNGGDPANFEPHIRVSPESTERKKRFTALITVWFGDLPDWLSDKYAASLNSSGLLPVRLRFRPKQRSLEYLLFANGRVKDGVSDGRISKAIHSDISKDILLRVIPESRDIQREFRTELGEAFATMRESVIEAGHGKAAKAAAELHQALSEILEGSLAKKLNTNLGNIIPEHWFKVGTLDQREFARIVMQEAFGRYPMCAKCPDGDSIDLEQIGAGFQSNVLIALYRSVASLTEKKLILCVEEPETHLDPNAQRRTYHDWSRLSSDDREVEQILINSHSAFIVNEAQPEEIVVVRRDGNNRTVTSQLTTDFLAKNDAVHLKTKILGLRNSDVFFSDGIVLVEGDSDAVAVRGCLDLMLKRNPVAGQTSLSGLGISVIDCGGAKSIPPLARILKQLCIPFVMVFDKDFLQLTDDKSGGDRSFRPELNRSFNALESLVGSTPAFRALMRSIDDRLAGGVPSCYPRKINKLLATHGILVMRTEHETDFICRKNARHVAATLGYRIPIDESVEDTVYKLKRKHKKQVKLAHVTARIIMRMSSAGEVPCNYMQLCNDILRVLGLKDWPG